MKVLIVTILLIAIILLLIIASREIKRRSYLRRIIDKYPRQVTVLSGMPLGCTNKTVAKLILSIPYDDWDNWSKKKDALVTLSRDYSGVISDYILRYFPIVKETTLYNKEFNIFASAEKRCKILIECLQYDDILKLSQISPEEWTNRKEIKAQADAIILASPDAIMELRKINPDIDEEDIVRQNKRIELIQLRYNIASAFEGWIKRQEEFSKLVRNARDTHAKNCGCYSYMVNFEKPLSNGKRYPNQFKLWQIFYASMSPYYLKYQSESCRSVYNKLTEFKEQRRYYVDDVYQNIVPYIEAVSKERRVVVLFNNHTSYNWDKDCYDYHYDYLSSYLSERGIEWVDVEELPDRTSPLNCDIVFVVDFITTNPDLLYLSKLIIESFTTKVPTIVWYSMIKEYDESESKELCKDAIAKEIEIKSFIKNQFLAVNKHSFYSYYAITNTLIGEAANASAIKPMWLSESNKYCIKSVDKIGNISVQYTTDGGISWNNYEMPGSFQNLNDVIEFTYNIFELMGVLNEFLETGSKAIEGINSNHFLAYD